MPFASQFEKFDPLSGDIPSWPFRSLPQIANRARSLVKKRTVEQIECIAISADWMIDEYIHDVKKDEEIRRLRAIIEDSQCNQVPPNIEWEEALRFFEVEETGHIRFIPEMETELLDSIAEGFGEVEALRACIGFYDLADDPWCPDAKEYEYFAVLSVWLVADTIKWLEWPKDRQQLEDRLSAITSLSVPDKTNPWFQTLKNLMDLFKQQIPEIGRIYEPVRKVITDEKLWLSFAANKAIRAMEAVCFAEHLKQVPESVAEAVEAKQKIKMDKVLIARHAMSRAAQVLLQKDWARNPNRFRSAEKAADHYVPWLTKQNYNETNKYPEYTHRTVVDWIRAAAKIERKRFR